MKLSFLNKVLLIFVAIGVVIDLFLFNSYYQSVKSIEMAPRVLGSFTYNNSVVLTNFNKIQALNSKDIQVIPGEFVAFGGDSLKLNNTIQKTWGDSSVDTSGTFYKSNSSVSSNFIVLKAPEFISKNISSNLGNFYSTSLAKDINFELSTSNIKVSNYDFIKASISYAQTLKQTYGFDYVEPNYLYHTFAPNDTHYNKQWYLKNRGRGDGIANKDITYETLLNNNYLPSTGEIRVAVVDSGIDYNHKDLKNRVLKEGGQLVGYDFVNNDIYPFDDYGHGTHVSGIIAAEQNNSKGISGICNTCKIMPIKFISNKGVGSLFDAVLSLQYAKDHNASVVNASWGSYYYSNILNQKVQDLYNHNIQVIASAGNDAKSYLAYPSKYPNVISVGALDNRGKVTYYSNYSSQLTTFAFGGDYNYNNTTCPYSPNKSLLSTLPSNSYLTRRIKKSCISQIYGNSTEYYSSLSGTSIAAPQVTAAIAIFKERYPNVDTLNMYVKLFSSLNTNVQPSKIFKSFGYLNIFKFISPDIGEVVRSR